MPTIYALLISLLLYQSLEFWTSENCHLCLLEDSFLIQETRKSKKQLPLSSHIALKPACMDAGCTEQ